MTITEYENQVKEIVANIMIALQVDGQNPHKTKREEAPGKIPMVPMK